MAVDTKKVAGRRQVRYESFDDLLADAQQLASSEVRTLGNWSQGQIYEHLTRSLNSSIDGVGFSFPLPMRLVMSLVLKRRFLTKGLPAGFQAKERFVPEEIPLEPALAALEAAIARQEREPQRVKHPGFGNIGKEGWDLFHLRHAEMHMSFLVGGDGSTPLIATREPHSIK
jgi:hypothetical protein